MWYSIIWFSSSCVRPLWPCVLLLRASGDCGAHGADCGGGVCTGVIGGLQKQIEERINRDFS